ncbi:MAG TPA: hypothetical protein VG758_26990 [Hyphomicrobiaceae bacterium]|jgi:hypothetical protein|nr:hypothetical protein [Hyphomicrobiaceae bacterium]
MRINTSRVMVVLVICVASATTANGQSSAQNAQLGARAWLAFECSALATYVDDKKQGGRLFKVGYESGKSFLGALQSGKIQEDDIRTRVPAGVMRKITGPNVDFVLGGIWESASQNALKDVFKSSGDEARILAAKTLFIRRKCSSM